MNPTNYVRCELSEIPDAVRFDVPRANQGQTIEIAYGTFSRWEAGPGDPYKRVTDHSIGPATEEYYKLVKE